MSLQEINCSVEKCEHNKMGQKCSLSSISVGKTKEQTSSTKDTECGSFKCC